MSGGEWVRLPNGNYRYFTDQELAEMAAAHWEENKHGIYVLASIGAIISISFGSFLLYIAIDAGELIGYITFGGLGAILLIFGICMFKSYYPDILKTFFLTLIVVALSLWGLYSCIFGGSEEEKQRQEQTETDSPSEEKSGEYKPIPASFYEYSQPSR